MHKCTLSRMASTHCWRSLSLQIEMQVSLRHFLCFPGIAQSQLLQKISRLARSASTGPPPARGARAGQGRVGTSTVWSLFDCAFAHFRWRWSSFMYLILVKSITFFALNMSSPLCPRDLKLQLAARSASGIQECLAKDLKINCWIFQKQKRRKSTSPAICRKWEKCFIYHCLSTSAPPVKATPRPQKKLQSEDVKIDEWLGSNLYAHTNHLFKDSIKSDHNDQFIWRPKSCSPHFLGNFSFVTFQWNLRQENWWPAKSLNKSEVVYNSACSAKDIQSSNFPAFVRGWVQSHSNACWNSSCW